MATIKFKNRYSEMRRKEEFDTIPDPTELTDQSQHACASITEMAKKYGIEAIIARAKRDYLEPALQDKLYGHDYTKMFTSAEERLNVKNKLTNLFENIPAQMRKEQFGDSIANFIDAYVTNDEQKLTKLNTLGIVSDSQLATVREYNENLRAQRAENESRQNFITALEKEKEGLYENWKTTGNISISNNQTNTTDD